MNKYSLIGLLILLITCTAGGFYLGKGEVITKEGKTITIEKIRTVTVTRTIRPDGTVEEKTTTEDRAVETKKTKKNTAPALADYSVGSKYWMSRERMQKSTLSNVEITVGRRLLGDIWIEAGVLPVDLEIAVGISAKF
jgi:hypothetical protein